MGQLVLLSGTIWHAHHDFPLYEGLAPPLPGLPCRHRPDYRLLSNPGAYQKPRAFLPPCVPPGLMIGEYGEIYCEGY